MPQQGSLEPQMWADRTMIVSLEHQVNEASSLITKMQDGLALKEAQGQIATLEWSSNERLDVLKQEIVNLQAQLA